MQKVSRRKKRTMEEIKESRLGRKLVRNNGKKEGRKEGRTE